MSTKKKTAAPGKVGRPKRDILRAEALKTHDAVVCAADHAYNLVVEVAGKAYYDTLHAIDAGADE